MAFEMKLNGHTAAELRAAVLTATQTFGWQVETIEPRIKDSWPAETEAVIAIFNITCKGDLYRLTITIQSKRNKQYCIMDCRQSVVAGSPCVQDDSLYDHCNTLGHAIAAVVQ